MSNSENKQVAGKDGVHEFSMQYGGRELACRVEKEGDKLKVSLDNQMTAELEIHWDNTITQVSGNTLPESNIEFIKKEVLGQHK